MSNWQRYCWAMVGLNVATMLHSIANHDMTIFIIGSLCAAYFVASGNKESAGNQSEKA
jgi:hypothetical protein